MKKLEARDLMMTEMYYTIGEKRANGGNSGKLYTFEEVKNFFNFEDRNDITDLYDLEEALNEEYEGMACPYEIKEYF